jgi:hypothetical protein
MVALLDNRNGLRWDIPFLHAQACAQAKHSPLVIDVGDGAAHGGLAQIRRPRHIHAQRGSFSRVEAQRQRRYLCLNLLSRGLFSGLTCVSRSKVVAAVTEYKRPMPDLYLPQTCFPRDVGRQIHVR